MYILSLRQSGLHKQPDNHVVREQHRYYACRHYDADFGIECRIARFHNIYGPYGTWKGGREKAPAAFCRKALCAQVRDPCRHL